MSALGRYYKAWTGTQKAMDELQFTSTSKQKLAISTELIARRGIGKKVAVILKRKPDTSTGIKIRAGSFGEEYVSSEIPKSIRKHYQWPRVPCVKSEKHPLTISWSKDTDYGGYFVSSYLFG